MFRSSSSAFELCLFDRVCTHVLSVKQTRRHLLPEGLGANISSSNFSTKNVMLVFIYLNVSCSCFLTSYAPPMSTCRATLRNFSEISQIASTVFSSFSLAVCSYYCPLFGVYRSDIGYERGKEIRK